MQTNVTDTVTAIQELSDYEWVKYLKGNLLAENSTYTFQDTNLPCTNFHFTNFAECQSSDEELCVLLSQKLDTFENSWTQEFFTLEGQPEPFQRKSYPHNKRKEKRHFKPSLIKVTPKKEYQHQILQGLAIMQMIDENMKPILDQQPQICEMDSIMKTFTFSPIALGTSKGTHYRLQFKINFLLEDGEQKSQVITSKKFRIVSRITQKQRQETMDIKAEPNDNEKDLWYRSYPINLSV